MVSIDNGTSVTVVALVFGLMLASVTERRALQKQIVSYSASPAVSLHEPVVVSITINNIRSETLRIDLGGNRKGGFRIAVTNPSGERRRLSPLVKVREGIVGGGLVTLEPGESYTRRLVVDEWYEFSKLGKYLIEVGLGNSPLNERGNIVTVPRKFSATVEVTATEAGRLRSVCESLMQQLLVSESYEKNAETAEILSYVKDPIAVPYLSKVLDANKMVDQLAIDGLRRVGNSDAAHVLISAIQRKDETALLAGQALGYLLEDERTPPPLKEEIRRALKDVPK